MWLSALFCRFVCLRLCSRLSVCHTLYTRLSVCPHTSGWRVASSFSRPPAVRPACRCVGVSCSAAEGRGSALPLRRFPPARNDQAAARPGRKNPGRRRAAGAGGRGVGGCAGPAEGRAGLRQGRAGTGKPLPPPPPRPGIAGPGPRPGPARPALRRAGRGGKGAPATPEPERSGIRAGTGDARRGAEQAGTSWSRNWSRQCGARSGRAAKPSKGAWGWGRRWGGAGRGSGPFPRALQRPSARTHRGRSGTLRGGTTARFERDPLSRRIPAPTPAPRTILPGPAGTWLPLNMPSGPGMESTPRLLA